MRTLASIASCIVLLALGPAFTDSVDAVTKQVTALEKAAANAAAANAAAAAAAANANAAAAGSARAAAAKAGTNAAAAKATAAAAAANAAAAASTESIARNKSWTDSLKNQTNALNDQGIKILGVKMKDTGMAVPRHDIRIIGIPGWAFALLLSVIGSFCSVTGLLLMKHSDNMGETEMPLYKRWRWWCGLILLVLLASVIDLPALALANLSLLAPLSGVGILITSVFSHFGVLSVRDSLDGPAVRSILVVWSGVTVTSVFGPHSDVKLSHEQMLDRLGHASFLSVLGGLGLFALFLVLLHTMVLHAAGINKYWQSHAAALHSIAFGFCAATAGACTALLLKIFSTCMRAAVQGDGSVFKSARPFLTLAAIAISAPTQLTALNHSMRANLFWLSNSIYLSLLILCSTFIGGFFFDEIQGLQGSHLAFFSLGVALTIVGVTLLYMRPAKNSDAADEAQGADSKGLLSVNPTDQSDIYTW